MFIPLAFFARLFRIFGRLNRSNKFTREVGILGSSVLVLCLGSSLTEETFVPSPAMAAVPLYIAFLMAAVVALYRTEALFSAEAYVLTTAQPQI
jgi:peptidoglycan/LPS O-acetylase OafA/YrhL